MPRRSSKCCALQRPIIDDEAAKTASQSNKRKKPPLVVTTSSPNPGAKELDFSGTDVDESSGVDAALGHTFASSGSTRRILISGSSPSAIPIVRHEEPHPQDVTKTLTSGEQFEVRPVLSIETPHGLVKATPSPSSKSRGTASPTRSITSPTPSRTSSLGNIYLRRLSEATAATGVSGSPGPAGGLLRERQNDICQNKKTLPKRRLRFVGAFAKIFCSGKSSGRVKVKARSGPERTADEPPRSAAGATALLEGTTGPPTSAPGYNVAAPHAKMKMNRLQLEEKELVAAGVEDRALAQETGFIKANWHRKGSRSLILLPSITGGGGGAGSTKANAAATTGTAVVGESHSSSSSSSSKGGGMKSLSLLTSSSSDVCGAGGAPKKSKTSLFRRALSRGVGGTSSSSNSGQNGGTSLPDDSVVAPSDIRLRKRSISDPGAASSVSVFPPGFWYYLEEQTRSDYLIPLNTKLSSAGASTSAGGSSSSTPAPVVFEEEKQILSTSTSPCSSASSSPHTSRFGKQLRLIPDKDGQGPATAAPPAAAIRGPHTSREMRLFYDSGRIYANTSIMSSTFGEDISNPRVYYGLRQVFPDVKKCFYLPPVKPATRAAENKALFIIDESEEEDEQDDW
ncbi:unnamed protein product [Amoebophrya sp. A25]|nr:unnamed protein product [Amoebophrya sp. A25]|eukprot:GSA25T00009260001.1